MEVNENNLVPRLAISEMRQGYMERGQSFTEDQLIAKEPIQQFREWFEIARSVKSIVEPNAMCLATATKEGRPSCRMVLLKGFNEEGFKFYTNYDSRKGKEISENPFVALNFFWEPVRKAVRIEGTIKRLSEEEATKYYHSRPIGSQIGSAISQQSQVIESRNVLMQKENAMSLEYTDGNLVPKPENWGGFLVVPDVIEFWQGHVNRLHDRIRFRKPGSNEELPDGKLTHQGENGWVYERLAP